MAITTLMNEDDDLISRLRAFGRRPDDPGLAADGTTSTIAVPVPVPGLGS